MATRRRDPSDRDTDDRLIRRVATGDTTAWPLLVERHLAAIVAHAWYFLHDSAEAEDVAQESFVRLMAKSRDWAPGGPKLRTWLYRVASNLCIDRQRARRTVSLDAMEESGPRLVDDRMPDGDLDHRRLVRRALDRLPEKQRLAMILIYYQGFTNREAAELMESSVEAVESLLARARRTLRRELDSERPDLLGALR